MRSLLGLPPSFAPDPPRSQLGPVVNARSLEILREMVDTGVISSTQLSPEVRLGMLLVQVGVHRMERNRCSKNCDGGSASQGSK